MKTHYSNVKSELEFLGYSFHKCNDGYWNFSEGGVIIESSRWLGELLTKLAKDFQI